MILEKLLMKLKFSCIIKKSKGAGNHIRLFCDYFRGERKKQDHGGEK